MSIYVPLYDSDGATGNSAVLPTADLSTTRDPTGVCYSGLKFGSDGYLYKRQPNGGWSSIGAWLLGGTNSTFYVSRVVNSGTLTTDGGTIQQLNGDEIYDVQQSTPGGFKVATVTFSIYDNGSETTQNGFPVTKAYTFSAELQGA